ncbi:MoeA C-terminal domain IV [Penicillium cosmopolitanum]|uniref:MoeA C-terminal domain IV n=1 Tax=Penicillium cosmopolitanum TaxID=1131564 RepID=A0A9X0BAQ1_9EURO|nr:MoeA C-terminal domain IV [Penicillium cosmopolitanum]KAJ5397939.1 MoeA C-terminal domain IV [Penicillium cosmopolitanum]
MPSPPSSPRRVSGNPPAIKIVPDNVFQIQQAVCEWSDSANWYNLILLSGGTGFAIKDNTPEAVSPLIHRHAPGLVHGMIAASLKVTPCEMTSPYPPWQFVWEIPRHLEAYTSWSPIAGVRDKSLIITLPGSPKGAIENLEAVVKLLPHACLQSAGANSRNMHAAGLKSLEAEAGSNDPSAGPNRRYRSSPYPMLSVEEALMQISEHTPEPIIVDAPVNTAIVGSVVAEDVYAAESVPAYKASIVDGYAVIAPDSTNNAPSTKGVFPVASITHANVGGSLKPLQPGTIARITTGAPLPPNANAVVMVEDTDLVSSTADGTEEATVEILTGDIEPGENVREPGSDVRLGEKILTRGDIISPAGGEIGLLASTGIRTVKVFRKPRVGVLSTGDELVEHDDPCTLTGGQIRDSNRPSLLSCLSSWGFPTVDLGIARDTPASELEHALRDSLRGVGRASSSVDVIVTTGGVSMGELDLLKPTIERTLGGTIHFGRVSMKPGKPTTFATIPFKEAGDGNTQQERKSKLIFSLPGNPASALVTLNLFVLPSLHKLCGLGESSRALSTKPWLAPQLGLPRVAVVLTHHFPLDPKRTEYHRAVVTGSRSDGRLYATSTGVEGVGQRSSRVGSLASANALVVLRPGRGVGIKGEIVEALMMGSVYGSDTRLIC